MQSSSRKVIYTSHGNFCGSYSRIDERRRVIFGMLSNTKTFSSRIKWIISIHERINSSLFIRWSDSSGYVWIERERARLKKKTKKKDENRKKKKIWKKVREKMIVRLESFRAFSQTSTRDLSRPITSGEQHRWLFARLKHSPFRRFCFWSRKRSEGVRWFISRTPYWAAASGTRPRKFPKLFSPLSTDLSDHFLAFEILANPLPSRKNSILICEILETTPLLAIDKSLVDRFLGKNWRKHRRQMYI